MISRYIYAQSDDYSYGLYTHLAWNNTHNLLEDVTEAENHFPGGSEGIGDGEGVLQDLRAVLLELEHIAEVSVKRSLNHHFESLDILKALTL